MQESAAAATAGGGGPVAGPGLGQDDPTDCVFLGVDPADGSRRWVRTRGRTHALAGPSAGTAQHRTAEMKMEGAGCSVHFYCWHCLLLLLCRWGKGERTA